MHSTISSSPFWLKLTSWLLLSFFEFCFVISSLSCSLYKDSELVNLTKREKEFINLLIENKNSSVKIDKIKESLWDIEDVSDERLRTFIKRLRVKTSKDLIENVSSQGYMVSILD